MVPEVQQYPRLVLAAESTEGIVDATNAYVLIFLQLVSFFIWLIVSVTILLVSRIPFGAYLFVNIRPDNFVNQNNKEWKDEFY